MRACVCVCASALILSYQQTHLYLYREKASGSSGGGIKITYVHLHHRDDHHRRDVDDLFVEKKSVFRDTAFDLDRRRRRRFSHILISINDLLLFFVFTCILSFARHSLQFSSHSIQFISCHMFFVNSIPTLGKFKFMTSTFCVYTNIARHRAWAEQ